ncbi:MAG TPA: ATP-binding protein [Acidobacteriaceae bacterium]|nr:ATP-binding protein [Acidobacteriaceae bacterium]
MRYLSIFVTGYRKSAILTIALMIALIAFFDWRASEEIPLGFLYLFPMLLVGSRYGRVAIAGVALVCTLLTEIFDAFPWTLNAGMPRDILYFAAFSCMGLFVFEVTRSRRLSAQHMEQIESEMNARQEAEEQLKVLIDSSPAAIFTATPTGHILLANEAAHRLFGLQAGTMPGLPLRDFLPSLIHVPAVDGTHHPFRTSMQCQGRRADGEVFQADVWFSTYLTSAGPRLAAMVFDTSEDLRTREEASLHQLAVGSRILVAAVSHEVRNVCGAIALVHENLTRSGDLTENKDFETLGTLVLALERIAAMDLRQAASHAATVDIRALLDELRIVIEPSLRDAGVSVIWELERELPPVWADRQSLMQVFLNLTKNSERAMEERIEKRLAIRARHDGLQVSICFTDTGGGVTHPDRLFRPFQREAQSTGLGLYLSRAFMRSFRGDLRYEPAAGGSAFVVELSPALRESEDDEYERQDPDLAGGRPQPVPRKPEPAPSNRI